MKYSHKIDDGSPAYHSWHIHMLIDKRLKEQVLDQKDEYPSGDTNSTNPVGTYDKKDEMDANNIDFSDITDSDGNLDLDKINSLLKADYDLIRAEEKERLEEIRNRDSILPIRARSCISAYVTEMNDPTNLVTGYQSY